MIINPKTRAVSLLPFKWGGANLRIVGTRCSTDRKDWFHTVKNEDTGEFKIKEHKWVMDVNRRIIEDEK
tara:strand:+ start:72 stop:278 length:207 start_codon:yes stop_codon:yes gene_type:complete